MTSAGPSFSVIVPTRNRPKQLAACLRALSALDYPPDRFEVLVVDDGSEPPVEGRVSAGALGERVIWVRLENAGPGAARNAAAPLARGEYLAFTDDDCEPAADWLTQLGRVLGTQPHALVGGRTVNALPGNRYAEASQIIVDTARGFFFEADSDLRFLASNNFSVATELFRRVGGFDPSFRTAEDRDFCDRWRCAGYALTYAPDAVVLHGHDLTLPSFWRQHFGYGRGACRFHRARARRGAGSLRPALAFYRRVFASAVGGSRGGRAWSLGALFVLWQLANTAGFVWEAAQRSKGLSPARNCAWPRVDSSTSGRPRKL